MEVYALDDYVFIYLIVLLFGCWFNSATCKRLPYLKGSVFLMSGVIASTVVIASIQCLTIVVMGKTIIEEVVGVIMYRLFTLTEENLILLLAGNVTFCVVTTRSLLPYMLPPIPARRGKQSTESCVSSESVSTLPPIQIIKM